jgi:hypothetical protein
MTGTMSSVYIMMVKSAVFYESETWIMTVSDMERLNTWDRKV